MGMVAVQSFYNGLDRPLATVRPATSPGARSGDYEQNQIFLYRSRRLQRCRPGARHSSTSSV